MIAKFTDDLLTGNDTIDFQHREIYRRIELLFNAAKQGLGVEKIDETLKFFEVYTIEHFFDEEALMDDYTFPDKTAHTSQHFQFKNDIAQLISKSQNLDNPHNLLIDTLKTSLLWIGGHIQTSDKAFAQFINRQSTLSKV